ncbi:MAG: tetratricopeptide repeat protein [Alphaproteobacteria bacterium]|nr:tetratricopeptide repeat protein [Alphaproteobacteria bacterium]
MIADQYYGQHSTSAAEAVHAFEQAVFAVAAHRPAAEPLNRALEADDTLVAGHALKGLGVALLGKAEDFAKARALLTPAQDALSRADGGTDYEQALVQALQLASCGRLKAAAARLEAQVSHNPRDFLCLKLANALRFMTGEAHHMRETSATALRSMASSDAGYGFALGMHAFGLEEMGSFAEAESIGLLAVTNQRSDIWGVHAVGHVLEMRGRAAEGARWIESSRQLWPHCNNFTFHMAWHLALFHLEAQDYDAVLDLYDREIRPVETDDFRDMANAVSMLWRLEQEGIDVGDRWRRLHEIAHRRRSDATYVFASLHYLLALLGSGDTAAARELVGNLRDRALTAGLDDQAEVAAAVGVELAAAILTLHSGATAPANLCELSLNLPKLGGSRAQRDVFMRTLLLMAANSGNPAAFDAVNKVRTAMKSEDRFARVTHKRLSETAA